MRDKNKKPMIQGCSKSFKKDIIVIIVICLSLTCFIYFYQPGSTHDTRTMMDDIFLNITCTIPILTMLLLIFLRILEEQNKKIMKDLS